MKKFLAALAGIVMCVTLFAACSNTQAPPSNDEEVDNTPSAP